MEASLVAFMGTGTKVDDLNSKLSILCLLPFSSISSHLPFLSRLISKAMLLTSSVFFSPFMPIVFLTVVQFCDMFLSAILF